MVIPRNLGNVMIRVKTSHLPVAAKSHPGMSGKGNEDQFGIAAFTLSAEDPTPVLVAVLADGIGGHQAGEVASEKTVNILLDHIAKSDGHRPTLIIQEAVDQASEAILSQSKANTKQNGMGSTCALVWVIADRLYTATIGDSRIYLFHRGRLQQLSKDHTWIQEALDRAIITPAQIGGHPNAHVIRRYLGSQKPPSADFRIRLHPRENDARTEGRQGMRLQEGDILLLCSDGLTDVVPDAEIERHLRQFGIEAAVPRLIDLANKHGGPDNITIIAVRYIAS
jgi:serine/threonine protein phosphatase PrpC